MTKPAACHGMTRRGFIGMALSAGALLALPGCTRTSASTSSEATTETTQETVEQKTCRVHIGNPAYIEPYNVYESSGMQICRMLFEPLLRYDYQSLQILPAAASSWSVSDDGLTYTFELAEDAQFTNGESVTSSSFKYAWERLVNPKTNPDDPSRLSSFLSIISGYTDFINGTATGINGIRALDDLTLEVTLQGAYPEFTLMVCHPAFSPVPSVASDLATFARCPIGNGPYMMDGDWVDEQYIYLDRNGSFHGDAPSIDRLEMMVFDDDSTAYLEFLAGNLDIVSVPFSSYADETRSLSPSEDGYALTGNLHLADGVLDATCYLVVNISDPSLASADLRRAISLAIDRQTICDTVYAGVCRPADGIIPPGIDGYVEGAWESCAYDVTAALQALSDAGYPQGQGAPSVRLAFGDSDESAKVVELISENLSAVGLAVQTEKHAWSEYETVVDKGSFQLAQASWMADNPSYDSVLSPLFRSTSRFNYGQYSAPEFDAALTEASALLDDSARQDAYTALDALVEQDMPVIPLFFYAWHEATSSQMTKLYCDPSGFLDLPHAEMV